ncbi:small s protein [Apiospora arundinis]
MPPNILVGMAEAAGLAIGIVALVSLFQTCIETCEYIESGRDLMSDVSLAVTKVSLLKARLYQWGSSISLENESTGSENFSDMLCGRWPDDHESIRGGLSQISQILEKTLLLSGRYCLAKAVLPAGECSSTTFCRRPLAPNYSGTSETGGRYLNDRNAKFTTKDVTDGSNTFLLRKRISWAVRDKKKLNAWLLDLEFLITSLEELKEGSSGKMPPPAAKPAEKKKPYAAVKERDMEKDRRFARPLANSSSALVRSVKSPPQSALVTTRRPFASPTSSPSPSPTPQPVGAASRNVYTRIVNKRTAAVHGDVDPCGANQGGVGNRYDNTVSVDSTVLYGNAPSGAFEAFMRMGIKMIGEKNKGSKEMDESDEDLVA